MNDFGFDSIYEKLFGSKSLITLNPDVNVSSLSLEIPTAVWYVLGGIVLLLIIKK